MDLKIEVLPRQTMTRAEFLSSTPRKSIALDGVVSGGPFFDPQTLHVNFDHHDGVIREATMSTCMQVYMAIKGGIAKSFTGDVHVYINDTDQDTSLAVWLLKKYKLFEDAQSVPHINRLLALDDRLDITGGAFPINLNEEIVEKHKWVFQPYSDLRTSGALATASAEVMMSNLEAVMYRLEQFLMDHAERIPLDTRHNIFYQGPLYWMAEEIGGSDSRYFMYSQGMNAFVNLVARRPDGRFVYSIGRRSQFIPFPIPELYEAFNEADEFKGWGGSDIIGGSPRRTGSSLSWEELKQIIDRILG